MALGNSVGLAGSPVLTPVKMKGQEMECFRKALKVETVHSEGAEEGKKGEEKGD